MSEPDNLVLQSWTTEAWTFVEARSVTTEISAGEVLCHQGELLPHLIFPQSGLISALTATTEDRSVEMASFSREGVYGLAQLLSPGACEGDIRVIVPGIVTLVPHHSINEALTRFTRVRWSLTRYAAFVSHALMQTIASERSCTAEQRIALWLLITRTKLRTPDIPITHGTLSELLGLRRATVTNALTLFAQDGSVETARGVIRIVHPELLEARIRDDYRRWRGAYAELSKALMFDPMGA